MLSKIRFGDFKKNIGIRENRMEKRFENKIENKMEKRIKNKSETRSSFNVSEQSRGQGVFSFAKLFVIGLLFMFSVNVGFSTLTLNYIHFDPAIISAGDEVDIVIQYESKNLPFDVSNVDEDEYTYEVKLVQDDDLTKEYVMITDSLGDDVLGNIYSGEKFYRTFKVKVETDAPTGEYEFKLVGTWYKNGKPLDYSEELRFIMPVKKEGIVLDISSIITSPAQVRSGDKFVEIKTNIENVGEKSTKSVEIVLETKSDLIESSYSNNNRFWVGSIDSASSREVSFFLNLDDELPSGVHDLVFKLNYVDLEDNKYNKTVELPLLVKPRPYLQISKVEGNGLAGDTSKLKVWVKNEGEVSAEAIDVRVLKESSQPFEFDVRSAYIGELKPGEEGVAVFDIDVLRDAEEISHNLKLVIRAKGDTDEGDDNIYTFKRRATFDVVGVKQNDYVVYGAGLFVLVLVVFVGMKMVGKKSSKGGRRK